MADDAEHSAVRAMRLESSPAKLADGTAPECLAGNIDFPANPSPQPFFPFPGRYSLQLLHRAHKFISRNTAKIVIPVQQFHAGIADAREPPSHQSQTRPHLRHAPFPGSNSLFL